MSKLEKLLEPFSQSIFSKKEAIATLDLEKKEKARFLESISDDIKKCSNFVPPEVSEKANDKASKCKFDLFKMNWHDMKSADRKTFHFEHVNTVSSIRAKCLEANSSGDVLIILLKRIRIAWILKEEDKRLIENKFRTNRPDDAYEKVGIKLLTLAPR